MKGVAVVDAGGDKAVYKNGSGVGRKGGAEAINIAKVEICRLGDVIDMGLER